MGMRLSHPWEMPKPCPASEEIMPLVGLPERETWPNSCNLNCYTDGTDGIDWHTDDEPLFQGCCVRALLRR